MHNETPDRLFDPMFDRLNDQLSPVESRVREALFDTRVPAHPGWLLELASVETGTENRVAEHGCSVAPHSVAHCSVEEELSRFSDDVPPVRLSLKYEFLAELDRLDQRRHRVRQATLVAACCLLVAGLASLLPLRPATAQPVVHHEHNERASSPLNILRISGPVVPLVAENSSTDSWAMVDAYNEFESERRERLRRGLTGDLFKDQMLLGRPAQ